MLKTGNLQPVMQRKQHLRKVCIGLFLSFIGWMLAESCTHEAVLPNESLVINLRWNQAYTDETPAQVLTGLRWCLSFLGATMPADGDENLFRWIDKNRLRVDLNKAGFNPQAERALQRILFHLKESGEYDVTGGIDIGRFVMLTLNSSNHYYAITGAWSTYQQFRQNYRFQTKKAGVIESKVSYKHRIVEFPADSQVARTAYTATDVNGDLNSGIFTDVEYEVLDLMPNGQLRFGVFDVNGKRVSASDTLHTSAGKPAKCLWCHEINLQQPFLAISSVSGYYSPAEFTAHILARKNTLTQARAKLPKSSIDFNKKQDHEQTELLYITFMEPSAERLAAEWNIPLTQVIQILSGLPTHSHAEFPFLGTLYDRNQVDPLSPYGYQRVPQSAREFSAYEPNLLY